MLQHLGDVGVSLDKGIGFFLCSQDEVSKAKRQMPANWKALHQDSMHGLEAEVSNNFVCNFHLWPFSLPGCCCCWRFSVAEGIVESSSEASGGGDQLSTLS